MKHITILVLLSISISGCEEIFFEPDQVNDPVSNFDYLWNNMNERYSLFEYKKIDWDSVYAVYRPLVNENTASTELFNIMAEMLNILKDGHTNLRAQMDISRYFPYLEAPQNFNYNLVKGITWVISGLLVSCKIKSSMMSDISITGVLRLPLMNGNWTR